MTDKSGESSLAHIQLISSNGTSAQNATRTTPGENLAAGEGDKAANSFEALLAAGADALRAEQAALQRPVKKDAGDSLDPAAGKTTEATELPQLADAGNGSLPPLTEQAGDPAQLIAEQAQQLADGDTPSDATTAAAPLIVDAARETKPRAKAAPDALELPLSTQKTVPDRPATAAKAGADPTLSAQPPLHVPANPEVPHTLPNTPGTSVAPALQPTPSPAQLANAAPSTTPMSIDVPEPFGTNGWSNAFSQRVVLAVGRNDQLAEIRVNPPHLGPVEVKLTMSGDDNRVATVHFTAHHAGVREAIESAIPRLREMFNEAGISLGNATVGSESSGRETDESSRGSATTEQTGGNEANDQAARSATTINATIAGKVDTFA